MRDLFKAGKQVAMRTVPALIVCSLLAGALGGAVEDADRYMDQFLSATLPQFARLDHLDPASLYSFDIKVESTFLTNRDLEGKFRNGKLFGLSNPAALKRLDDCWATRHQGRSVVLGCHISLDGLRATYNGTVVGDDLAGTKKSVNVDVSLQGSKAFIEVASENGAVPVLKTWRVPTLKLHLTFSQALNLNSGRQREYEEEVYKNIDSAIAFSLYGSVQRIVADAVHVPGVKFPSPENSVF